MTTAEFKELLKKGEGSQTEFKKCRSDVSSSVYETICAFSNRLGGVLLLGVDDDGTILGVNPQTADGMIKNIINTLGNKETFQPTVRIEPELVYVDGRAVIVINVLPSLVPLRYKNRYFDRNGDADQNISDNSELVLSLFERKSHHIFEERIVPGLSLADFDDETFDFCRNQVRSTSFSHPWLEMSNEEILESCNLVKKSAAGTIEGYKYAALIAFGSERALAEHLSGYRFELLFHKMTYSRYLENRPEDITRYDDRKTLRKNVIQSYRDMMDFVERYLPDKFYLPGTGGTERQDLRVQLFREIVGNLCAHTDYGRRAPGFIEIFYDRVITRNSTRIVPEIGEGVMSIDDIGVYTKNPLLVRILSQLSWVEDLGSGKRNIKKFAPLYYSNYKIEINSSQQFVFSITYQDDIERAVAGQVAGQVTGQVTGQVMRLLNLLRNTQLPAKAIMERMNLKGRDNFRKSYLMPALAAGLVERVDEASPNSPQQKYRLTDAGIKQLNAKNR